MPITAEKTIIQAAMLGNRLRKRYRHLKKWAHRVGTDAFRLYDRDIPEIPLVLDWYGGLISGAVYERPYETTDEEEKAWAAAMKVSIADALERDTADVFLKTRRHQRGAAQYQRADEAEARCLEVKEGGLHFRVNVSDYLDTGLFLDRRAERALVRSQVAGASVLNLFCYTASFSIYALSGGASLCDSVDLSHTYLDWAEHNFALNNFPVVKLDSADFFERRPAVSALIRADVLPFLADAYYAGDRWDRVILDPPSFSNSKKMYTTLDVRRDYQSLIDNSLRLLKPGGTLWFSTNVHGFSFDEHAFPGVTVYNKQKHVASDDLSSDFQGRHGYYWALTPEDAEAALYPRAPGRDVRGAG
jgi:23S rRNA G2069 N7-methylase RlmK/C1962 C5-methylase RlmI